MATKQKCLRYARKDVYAIGNEVGMIPIDKIITGVTYDVIEVEGDIPQAVKWCIQTFGPPGHRWFISNRRFYFTQEKDAMLFELRW